MSTILVDLDSTVCDLFTPWLTMYREMHPDDPLTPREMLHYDSRRVAKYPEDIYKPFAAAEFFSRLQPYDGAIETVQALQEAGNEVIIATAALQPDGARDKLRWVAKWMPFVHSTNVMVGYRKDLLRADAIIDDAPATAEAYRKAWPGAFIAGISFPYNEPARQHYNLLADGWWAPGEAWKTLRQALLAEFVRGT